MARSTFGGGASDYVARLYTYGSQQLESRVPNATVALWTDDPANGGTQVTDLLVGGAAATSVQADANGNIGEFQGPDGLVELWASADGGQTGRFLYAAPTDGNVAAWVQDPATQTAGALSATLVAVITPQKHGAKGDGTADDSAAITAAVVDLTGAPKGTILYFPPGSYRYAQQSPASLGAITLDGLSDVAVVFAPGAELVMDNLDASNNGTSHGVYVKGAANNITLQGVKVRWLGSPVRSTPGDGFQILGYPSDSAPATGWTTTTGTVSNIKLIDCTTINAPQTGAVILGCSDVTVENFRVQDTKADGLHFNACRRVTVDGHHAVNSGDDGLAFVTYYDAANIWQSPVGPFNQPSVGDWSNDQSTATNVVINGGGANGVRLAGSKGVTVSGFSVSGKGSGIITDAGTAGGTYNWAYQASIGCAVSDFTVEACSNGFYGRPFNVTFADDPSFWQYDLLVSNGTVRGCSSFSLLCDGNGVANAGTAGISFDNIHAHDVWVKLASVRNASITNIFGHGVEVTIYGNESAVSPVDSMGWNNLIIDNIVSDGSAVLLQDLRGCAVGLLRSQNSTGTAVELVRLLDSDVEVIDSLYPNRANSGTTWGLLLTTVKRITVGRYTCTLDANVGAGFRPIEIGGGDATDVPDDIKIENATFRNTINQATSGVVIQGGSYGPTNWIYDLRFHNGGETTPVWRRERSGAVTWPEQFIGSGAPAIVAPAGSRYTDQAVTNGAAEWVKTSGTDGTGWSVVKGDTGWRRVVAAGDVTGRPGLTLLVRRVNDAVFAKVGDGAAPTSSGLFSLWTQPAGFVNTDVDTAADWTANVCIDTGANIIAGSTFYATTAFGLRAADLTPLRSSLQYPTSDPWPTSLPGVAV